MLGAVDIGGTKIAVAAVDEDGTIVARNEYPTFADPDPAGAMQQVLHMLAHCERQAGESFRGIGIGCTGPVDPRTGVVGDVDLLPGWQGVQLVKPLSKKFRVSVAVENDADAAALAEACWGVGRSASSFLYATISTGIGVGIVLNGRLYRGVGDAHPELGHQIIDPSGPLCYCGARGCLESLASGPALAAWVKENAKPKDRLPADPTAREICQLAREGHPLALKAVERLGYYLGLGLANLITTFCPDMITLGGGVMASADLFLDRAREVVRSCCGLVPSERTAITCASLGENVALLGAASVWLHRYEKLGGPTHVA